MDNHIIMSNSAETELGRAVITSKAPFHVVCGQLTERLDDFRCSKKFSDAEDLCLISRDAFANLYLGWTRGLYPRQSKKLVALFNSAKAAVLEVEEWNDEDLTLDEQSQYVQKYSQSITLRYELSKTLCEKNPQRITSAERIEVIIHVSKQLGISADL